MGVDGEPRCRDQALRVNRDWHRLNRRERLVPLLAGWAKTPDIVERAPFSGIHNERNRDSQEDRLPGAADQAPHAHPPDPGGNGVRAPPTRSSPALSSSLEWDTVIGDEVAATALLHRLLHFSPSVNILGESYLTRTRSGLGRNKCLVAPGADM